MRKLVVLAASAAACAAFFAAPSPASASCSVIIEEIGCLESAVCGAAGTVLERVPGKLGDDLHCIQ